MIFSRRRGLRGRAVVDFSLGDLDFCWIKAVSAIGPHVFPARTHDISCAAGDSPSLESWFHTSWYAAHSPALPLSPPPPSRSPPLPPPSSLEILSRRHRWILRSYASTRELFRIFFPLPPPPGVERNRMRAARGGEDSDFCAMILRVYVARRREHTFFHACHAKCV